jgi:hypothetical protein
MKQLSQVNCQYGISFAEPAEDEIDDFTNGYITCMLWAETDDEEHPLNTLYGIEDISEESLAKIISDCKSFQKHNAEDLDAAVEHGRNMEHLGHDFWLSRNGQGTGFWDRGLGDIGIRLDKAAKTAGSVDPYVGDDNKIHI